MTCYARTAGEMLTAWCRATFKERADEMGATMVSGALIDCFDHTGQISHKNIPADKYTQELGEPEGAGVYGAFGMSDGSLLLLTCRGKLAYVGKAEKARAEWVELRAEGDKV